MCKFGLSSCRVFFSLSLSLSLWGVFSCLFFSLWGSSRVFFSLSGVFSWNFGGVLVGRDPQMCAFSLWGCRVKAPGGLQAAGFSHDSPRIPNVHINGSRRFKHQNSTRRPPEGERKWEREREKSAKFWAVLWRAIRRKGGHLDHTQHTNTHTNTPTPSGLTRSGLTRTGPNSVGPNSVIATASTREREQFQ